MSFRADSGFRRVEAKKYTPRLLHVFGEKVLCLKCTSLSLMTSFLSSTTIFGSRNSWLRVPFSFKSLCLNAWNLNIILKESFYFQNKVTVKEVKFKKEYLNDEDVFLIDLGLQIFQVHFYCQTKRLFTWENSHRHEFHIEMTFLFRIAFTLWLGHFIS